MRAVCEYPQSHSQSGAAPLAPNDFEPETRVVIDIDTKKRKFILGKT
jgi:hypothetical protein